LPGRIKEFTTGTERRIAFESLENAIIFWGKGDW
jgi:hypothetical protein